MEFRWGKIVHITEPSLYFMRTSWPTASRYCTSNHIAVSFTIQSQCVLLVTYSNCVLFSWRRFQFWVNLWLRPVAKLCSPPTTSQLQLTRIMLPEIYRTSIKATQMKSTIWIHKQCYGTHIPSTYTYYLILFVKPLIL